MTACVFSLLYQIFHLTVIPYSLYEMLKYNICYGNILNVITILMPLLTCYMHSKYQCPLVKNIHKYFSMARSRQNFF